ncbi:restriction endonuclease [soil metagenome]
MAIPDFQTVMLPCLRITADGEEHRISDLVDRLASEFGLTQVERDVLLPSGRQGLFTNRVNWAITYLAKAGLVERTGRGRIRITDKGNSVLDDRPDRIDIRFLSRYPEIQAFRTRTSQPRASVRGGEVGTGTPEEQLEATYSAVRAAVESDLLDRVLASSPSFFERLVLDLLLAMGYGGTLAADAGRHVGRSGDEGIDGIIDQDKLGLDSVYIQAKRWLPSRPVSRPDLQAFNGSLDSQRASKGVFLTTSRFTDDAREYAERVSRRIVLVDGAALTKLMYDHGIGLREPRRYDVWRVDGAYFDGEP